MAPKRPLSTLLVLCLALSVQAAPTAEPAGSSSTHPPLVTLGEPLAATPTPSSISATAEDALLNFTMYLTPICKAPETIPAKSLASIQAQLKQFVELTHNKLALCFMESYHFDPAIKPVSADNLLTLCKSRDIPKENTTKGSYRAFQACAADNWDPAIDRELFKVLSKRLDCALNHPHAKADPAAVLSHDEEQLIDQLFGQTNSEAQKSLLSSPNVKFVDVGVAATGVGSGASPSSHAKLVHPANATKLLNDQNTMVVIIENPPAAAPSALNVTTTTTTITAANSSAPTAPTTTSAPASVQIEATGADNSKVSATSVNVTVHSADAISKEQKSAPSTVSSITEALTKDISLTVHHTTGAPTLGASSSAAPTETVAQITVHKTKETSERPPVAHTTGAPATTSAPSTPTPTTPAALSVHVSLHGSKAPEPTTTSGPSAAPTEGAAATSTTNSITTTTTVTKDVGLASHHSTTVAPASNATTAGPSTTAPPTAKASTSAAPTGASHTTTPKSSSLATTSEPHTVVDVKVHQAAESTTKRPPAAPTSQPSSTDKPSGAIEAPPSAGSSTSTSTTAAPLASSTSVSPSKAADSIAVKVNTKKHEVVRTVHSSVSSGHDAKLHQIEHDRQMASDPASHLLKHKKYELSKQRKLKAAELDDSHSTTSTSTSTTARPT